VVQTKVPAQGSLQVFRSIACSCITCVSISSDRCFNREGEGVVPAYDENVIEPLSTTKGFQTQNLENDLLYVLPVKLSRYLRSPHFPHCSTSMVKMSFIRYLCTSISQRYTCTRAPDAEPRMPISVSAVGTNVLG
jgi:hypothetical protein